MRYRTVICVLVVVPLIVGCGLFSDGQGLSSTPGTAPAEPVSVVPTNEPELTEQSAVLSVQESTPESSTSDDTAASEGPALGGPITLDEQILDADVIARARLTLVEPSSRWETSRGVREYVPFVNMHFDVVEALQGSPGSSVVVELQVASLETPTYETPNEAVLSATDWVANRDAQWDDRDAIIILWSVARIEYGNWRHGLPTEVGYWFSGYGDATFGIDEYSIHSERNRTWLPATSATPGSNPSFYLEVPSNQTADKTITLADLKAKIASVNSMVSNQTPAYKECLLYKARDLRSSTPKLPEFFSINEESIGSGLPANTAIITFGSLSDSEDYYELIIDGPDSSYFEQAITDDDSDSSNGYILSFVQKRPMPKGDYVVHLLLRKPISKPCDYIPNYRSQDTIHVVAPPGTLHELFFDPQSFGDAVIADADDGVLEPRNFTGAYEQAATIQRIEWQAGTVKLEANPHTGLTGHVVDFIELDGTVSLSLDVADATVDAANDRLSWSVSEQPWHNGDKLMVRIREAR